MIGALVITLAFAAYNNNHNQHETSITNPHHHHHHHQKPNHQTYEFHVAPMQGYTNAPLRHLFRLLSPNAILWTEMEKVCDLQHAINNHDEKALEKRFGSLANYNSNNNKLILQVGGNHVQELKTCVKALTARLGSDNFREINLNCGCPSIETGGGNFGASLTKDARLTRQLVQAISESCAPTTAVSLKCRTAVFDTAEQMMMMMASASHNKNHYKDQSFDTLCEYIDQARRGGISHVIVHARPAILAGLSPTKNRIVPSLDYDMVERVAAEFTDLRVTLNGGIASMEDLETLMIEQQQQHAEGSSASGIVGSHMAGRWMLQHPLALAAVQDKFLNTIHHNENNRYESFHHHDYDVSFLSSVLDQYMFFVQDSLSRKIHTLSELCLPLYLVIEELRMTFDDVDDDNIENSNRMSFEADLFLVLNDVMGRLSTLIPGGASSKARAFGSEDVNWKRLSKHLQDRVGKKVYNKWKRNRNEL